MAQNNCPSGQEWRLPLANDEHINVRQDGLAHGEPFVLIHAFAGSLKQWDDVADLLATKHWVVRIDLLGHGATDKPVAGDYSMPSQARRVAEVLAAFGADRYAMVGQSGGGNVVVAMLENPEINKRLTGAMVIGTPPNMSFVNLPPLANIYRVPLLGRLMWRITSRKMVSDTMANLFAPEASGVPDVVVDDFSRMTRHSYVAAKAALEGYAKTRALSDRVAHSTLPLYVVFGDQDQWISPVCTEEWHRTTNAKITLLPGVGHTPPLEVPTSVAELIGSSRGV
jgi:pimeloyl-ACP methyl ester carboxylesterase